MGGKKLQYHNQSKGRKKLISLNYPPFFLLCYQKKNTPFSRKRERERSVGSEADEKMSGRLNKEDEQILNKQMLKCRNAI